MRPGIALGASLAGLIWAGCAAPRGEGGRAGPFKETMLAPDSFRIDYQDEGYTHSARAQDLALLRAAELCGEKGFAYFKVLDEEPPGRTASFPKLKTGVLVKVFVKKPSGFFTFDAAFMLRSLREKYGIQPAAESSTASRGLPALRGLFAKLDPERHLRLALFDDPPNEFVFMGFYPGEDTVALRLAAGGRLSGRIFHLRDIRMAEPMDAPLR